MRVLFLTYLPSPYRLKFFTELGKECELTVLFERASAKHRDKSWAEFDFENFSGVILQGLGDSNYIPRLSVLKYIRKGYDHIIVHNPSTPTGIIAIEYMKLHKIQYWIEGDGAFINIGSGLKERIKRTVYSGAYGYFSTCKENDKFFSYYGADPKRIFRYPFTSLSERDIADVLKFTPQDKDIVRSILGMEEHFIVLSIGRFSYENGYGKGFDSLLKVAEKLKNRDIGFYIVGDNPTDEFIKRKNDLQLNQVHFVGFKQKEELAKYYMASDIFVLLTKCDVWGLVINEAMSFHLPVITTTKCGAGLELVEDNQNGYIVEPNDVETVAKHICFLYENGETLQRFSEMSCNKICSYTIENMCSVHTEILWGGVLAAREIARNKLRVEENIVILGIGQFIERKGFSDLLYAVSILNNKDLGVYIIGGNPLEEYLNIVHERQLNNIHFIPFMSQESLRDYFRAANLFVLPTHEDIWGLVINEAMRFCLPVITTSQCGAGLEMIRNEENGFLYQAGNIEALSKTIDNALYKANLKEIGLNAFNTAKSFTIENMVSSHREFLQNH